MSSLLKKTKEIALKYNVDLAIPNCEGSGIGNAMMYTRLVEEYALKLGRPISIFTGPLKPSIGTVSNENPFALWANNPYIQHIVNGEEVNEDDLKVINRDRSSLIQLNHIIENICWPYQITPREIRASLFLSKEEMQWGLEQLSGLKRPLICIHPSGTSRSREDSPWHQKNWSKLIECLKDKVGFFEIGRPEFGDLDVGLLNPAKKLRETMSLIWASDFYIGFDSAPMHIATAFRKPVICLFDMRQKFEKEKEYSVLYIPSVLLRWSYPFNKNIAIMENDLDCDSLKLVIKEIERFYKQLEE